MVRARDGRFVAPSWLARLIVGDVHCEWAPWFRANYQNWTKPESDFDFSSWNIKHTILMREIALEHEAAGERVFVEKQNNFRWLRDSGLTVVGTPDLVAVDGNHAVIIDAKTGQPQSFHKVQVLIYMLLLPQVHPQFAGMRPSGQLVYQSGRKDVIYPDEVTEFADQFEYFLDIVDTDVIPMRRPSEQECRFCDISSADCGERMAPDRQADEEQGLG